MRRFWRYPSVRMLVNLSRLGDEQSLAEDMLLLMLPLHLVDISKLFLDAFAEVDGVCYCYICID